MDRRQLKARAARDILRRLGEIERGRYHDSTQAPVDDLQLILLHDVERVGPDGVLSIDQTQISVLAEELAKVRREGTFTVCGKRWVVLEQVRNDGTIVTAAVRSA